MLPMPKHACAPQHAAHGYCGLLPMAGQRTLAGAVPLLDPASVAGSDDMCAHIVQPREHVSHVVLRDGPVLLDLLLKVAPPEPDFPESRHDLRPAASNRQGSPHHCAGRSSGIRTQVSALLPRGGGGGPRGRGACKWLAYAAEQRKPRANCMLDPERHVGNLPRDDPVSMSDAGLPSTEAHTTSGHLLPIPACRGHLQPTGNASNFTGALPASAS